REDAGDEVLFLLLSALADDRWPHLPLADEVIAGRRVVGDHLLVEDGLLHRAEFLAAVCLRRGQADPPLGRQLLAELAREVVRLGLTRRAPPGRQLGAEEVAHVLTKGVLRRREAKLHGEPPVRRNGVAGNRERERVRALSAAPAPGSYGGGRAAAM